MVLFNALAVTCLLAISFIVVMLPLEKDDEERRPLWGTMLVIYLLIIIPLVYVWGDGK